MDAHAMNKERWIELFQEIGLSEKQMQAWHRAFETRYPEGHQSFLEWLQLPGDEIRAIREQFSA